MKTKPLPIGTPVEIVKSNDTNIRPGDVGLINQTMKNGYCVEITKWFPAIVSHERGKTETRYPFFKFNEVKPCQKVN